MIAGIYVMNFKHMPELSSHYGYPGVIGLMILDCSSLYFFFSRRGWL